MFVIKKLLIQIILNLLLIGNNFNTFYCLEPAHSESSGANNFSNKHNRINVADSNKNDNKINYKPIYIYSTVLSDSETLTKAKHVNALKQNKFNAPKINKSQLIGELINNNNSVRNNNHNYGNDPILENLDFDKLIQVLENDNHTITSLLMDYVFDYGNTFTGVNACNKNVNDSSSSEINYFTVYDVQERREGRRRGTKRDQQPRTKHIKVKKKFKKFMLPLLLAYKLKFFALIPIIISGLVLLTGSTGLAGFFFALFAAVMGLKSKHHK